MVFCCPFPQKPKNVLFPLGVDEESYNKDFSSYVIPIKEDGKGIDAN